jgi:ribosomal protein S18 acetylase RimI-like enzyme
MEVVSNSAAAVIRTELFMVYLRAYFGPHPFLNASNSIMHGDAHANGGTTRGLVRIMPNKGISSIRVQVRRMEIEDLDLAVDAVRTVKAPQSDPSFNKKYLKKFLARPENLLIVAHQKSVPAGFLLAYSLDRVDRDRRMVCLYEVEVAEPYRRQGVGRTMIEALKTICKREKVMKIWVITNRSNLAAFHLYESTGGTADSSGDQVTFVYGPSQPI